MKKRIARILLSPGFFIPLSIILFLATMPYIAWVAYENSDAFFPIYSLYLLGYFLVFLPIPFGLIAILVALKNLYEHERKPLNLIAGTLGFLITSLFFLLPITYCGILLIIILWIGQKIVDCVTACKRRKQRPQEVYNYYYEYFLREK